MSLFDFFPIKSSLYLLGLLDIQFSRHQFKNSFTKVTEVSVLPSAGATIVESSAYLNNAGKPSYVISRSLRKILKRWGPLTLPCLEPFLTAFHLQ